MATLFQLFNRACGKKARSLGFTRWKNAYIRIGSEIIQTVSVDESAIQNISRIEFSLLPLCMPTPVFLWVGNNALENLTVNEFTEDMAVVSRMNEDELQDKLKAYIDNALFPFFNECNTCEKALKGLLRVEENAEINRLRKLQFVKDTDCAASLQERSMFDPKKYYMALKAKDDAYVERYLRFQVAHHERNLKGFSAPGTVKQPDIVIQRTQKQLSDLSEQLKRFASGDLDYFSNMLRENECEMRNFLSANYPKIPQDTPW